MADADRTTKLYFPARIDRNSGPGPVQRVTLNTDTRLMSNGEVQINIEETPENGRTRYWTLYLAPADAAAWGAQLVRAGGVNANG
jgi:hypothetical protein